MPIILEVTNLKKTFSLNDNGIKNLTVIDNLSFSIEYGSFVTFIGISGCGKTTLLKCLGGLTAPTGGRISWAFNSHNDSLPKCILVFQDYSKVLLPWRNVWSNVIFPLEAHGFNKSSSAEAVEAALKQVGLIDFKDYFPRQLSGGMQQRLQIARALVCKPSVLLLDEPFSSLDALTKAELERELLSIHDSLGLTILMVTHDIDEAIYLSDRVIVLSKPARTALDVSIDLPKHQSQIDVKSHLHFAELHRLLYSQLISR